MRLSWRSSRDSFCSALRGSCSVRRREPPQSSSWRSRQAVETAHLSLSSPARTATGSSCSWTPRMARSSVGCDAMSVVSDAIGAGRRRRSRSGTPLCGCSIGPWSQASSWLTQPGTRSRRCTSPLATRWPGRSPHLVGLIGPHRARLPNFVRPHGEVRPTCAMFCFSGRRII